MKRIFLFLSVFAVLTLAAVYGVTRGQQAVTDDVAIIPLPVPTNVIGTYIRGVSNDGKRIVFDSINSYTGNNVDSNKEIYVYDVDTRSVIQITNTLDLKDPADATKITLKVNNETPVISGDGTKIAFVSNAALGGTTNDDGNYEVYLASLPRGATTATFTRITDTEKNSNSEVVKEIFNNYSPSINDNGTLISFVSTRQVFKQITNGAASFTALKEGPSNSDPDGNGEIFVYSLNTRQYSQVTVSRDVDATVNFVVRGFNSNPTLSGDGRVMVFLSGFNYPGANANKNSDFNGELFLFKIGDAFNTFTQITETADRSAVPQNGAVNLLPSNTHPLSFDGTKLVFESAGDLAGQNSDKTREVFLADLSAAKPVFKQITNQATADLAKSDFNFFPSINSTGTYLVFTSVINLTPATTSGVKTDNADGSREVFRYDIAANKFRQLTFTPLSDLVLDQRFNFTSPHINEAGNLATFDYTGQLLTPTASIVTDVFQALVLPVTSKNTVEAKLANAASFDSVQVARASIVAAFGTQLANSTQNAGGANPPFDLGGVTVTVSGIAARIIYISPGQINFVVPFGVGNGDAVDFAINNNGVQSAGKVKLVDGAPGVFTVTGDGKGNTAAQCGRVSPDGLTFLATNPPCSVGNESQFNVLTIYGTGWRNVSGVQVKIGDQTLTPSFSGPQPEFQGLDQINVVLTKDLAGKTDLDVSVTIPTTTANESNKSKTSFLPFEAAVTTVNAASFEGSVVAAGSLAVAQGTELAGTTASSATPVTSLVGVSVTVAGAPALLNFVSPTQVNFFVAPEVKVADLVEVVINNNGKISRGRVKVLTASPGVFTTTGDGNGRASARCGKPNSDGSTTYTDPPCSVGTASSPNTLRIFGTGWRLADKVSLKVGTVDLTTLFAGAQPGAFGVDMIDVKLDPSLAGQTDVDVVVTTTVGTTTKSSKAGIKVSFTSN